MAKPETIRIKAHVRVAGMTPGEVGYIRKGYAEQLIKVGYATRVDNLDGALSAEPSKYGDWETDPRASNDEADGDGVADDDSFPQES